MEKALDLIEIGALPQRHSHAAVVVDKAGEVEAELSFFDYQRQTFIGKTGLSPEPYFFPARKQTLADGRIGYVVGPEVTRFLRRDARFGVSTRQGPLGDVRCNVRAYAAVISESNFDFGQAEKRTEQPSSASPTPPLSPTEPRAVAPEASIRAAVDPSGAEDKPTPSVLTALNAVSAPAERRPLLLLAAGGLLIAMTAGFLIWGGSEGRQRLGCAESSFGEILVNAGLLTPCEQPARVDPELAAYGTYAQCLATSSLCEREACTSAYLRVANSGEHAAIVRRNQMDATANCKAEQDREADFAAFNRCVSDTSDVCARKGCVDRYRSRLNVEPYLKTLQTVQEASIASCQLSRDEAVYAAFKRCVERADPCQRKSCADPLPERVRAGSHAQDIARVLNDASSLCGPGDTPNEVRPPIQAPDTKGIKLKKSIKPHTQRHFADEVQGSPRKNSQKKCFSFNGERYCE